MEPEAFERQQRSFFEHWRAYVQPHEEKRRNANDGAVAFGQAVLKTGLVLNGGGLILIPAYLALFKTPIAEHLVSIAGSGIGFVTGLVSAWLGIGAAYFTMAYQGLASDFDYSRAATNINEMHWPSNKTDDEKTDSITSLECKARRTWKVAERWRYTAIFLSLIGLLCFLAGAGFGAWAMLSPTWIMAELR